MPLTGDTGDIVGMRAALGELLKVPSQVATRAIPVLNKRLAKMFTNGVDPYGNKFAPLKPSTLKRKAAYANPGWILVRRGVMANETRFEAAAGAGIKLIVGPAGEQAQRGSYNREPRKIVPENGLPAEWRADIEKIARLVAKINKKR